MNGPEDGAMAVKPPQERRSALLVDDEEDFTSALAERLSLRHIHADTAVNGHDALRQAEQRRYDAIVLDLAMPGIDGLETLRRLLQINPDLQVIVLTGRGSTDKAVQAMKLGALDFLEKPVEIGTLIGLIDDAATKRTSLEQRRLDKKVDDIIRKKGW